MAFGSVFGLPVRLFNRILELRETAMLIARGLSNARGSSVRDLLQRTARELRESRESKRLSSEAAMKDILLIDDVRALPATRVARTYDEGIAQLKDKLPDLLLLDHDLGHVEPDKTGYGIVCFLEENDIKPKEIRLVTANPVGALKMEAALESMGYKYDHLLRTWYTK